jgi:hypothetical protein
VNDRMPGYQSVASVPENTLLLGFQADIAQDEMGVAEHPLLGAPLAGLDIDAEYSL